MEFYNFIFNLVSIEIFEFNFKSTILMEFLLLSFDIVPKLII